ncbi:hypothetical protein C3Z06_31940 (plasmid) [Cupriavidus metallidurans]|nr:hypothetical protein C3Z06_31940 [Cupriavidus metallidurans]
MATTGRQWQRYHWTKHAQGQQRQLMRRAFLATMTDAGNFLNFRDSATMPSPTKTIGMSPS